MKTKELLAWAFLTFVIVVLYSIFPAKNIFQNISTAVGFLVIMPLLYCVFTAKRPISDLGITKGYWRAGMLWSFVCLVFALLFFYVALMYTDFGYNYASSAPIIKDFWKFITYELFLVLPFIIIYEFFFRGFSMLFLGKRWGHGVIIFQSILFFIFLLIAGSVNWIFLPYIVFSFFSGLIAYRSRSIYYSIVSHLIFMIIVDASIIKLLQ